MLEYSDHLCCLLSVLNNFKFMYGNLKLFNLNFENLDMLQSLHYLVWHFVCWRSFLFLRGGKISKYALDLLRES